MTVRFDLQELDRGSTAARARYRAAANRIWPEYAQSDAELLHELAQAGPARTWIVVARADGRDVGAVHVERVRWNDETAPPIAFPMLDAASRSAEAYAELLAPCAGFAREHGFDELRVLAWERREHVLVATLLACEGWRIAERGLDVELDLDRAELPDRPVPVGVTLTTLAQRPDLERSMWEAHAAAIGDIPGDEPEVAPPLDEWRAERSGPVYRDEATFLAVRDGDVVGYVELTLPELARSEGWAWHGYTAVRPDARGRGIATALKLEAIHWARANGIRRLRTENEERNAPMRHINAQLGYEPMPAHVILRGACADLVRA